MPMKKNEMFLAGMWATIALYWLNLISTDWTWCKKSIITCPAPGILVTAIVVAVFLTIMVAIENTRTTYI